MDELREAIQMSQLNRTRCHVYWVPTESKTKARACITSMYPGSVVANYADSVRKFGWKKFSPAPIIIQQRDRALTVIL
jgi:hypothetical protein